MRTSRLSLFLSPLIILAICSNGCQKVEQQGSSRRYIQVSAEQRSYQESMERLEEFKGRIDNYKRNYNQATEYRIDGTDDRDAEDKAALIKSTAEVMLAYAQKSMSNDRVIRQVSSATSTYREYIEYAQKMIRDFE